MNILEQAFITKTPPAPFDKYIIWLDAEGKVFVFNKDRQKRVKYTMKKWSIHIMLYNKNEYASISGTKKIVNYLRWEWSFDDIANVVTKKDYEEKKTSDLAMKSKIRDFLENWWSKFVIYDLLEEKELIFEALDYHYQIKCAVDWN